MRLCHRDRIALVAVAVVAASTARGARAQTVTLGYTSFEEPVIGAGATVAPLYTDSDATTHALVGAVDWGTYSSPVTYSRVSCLSSSAELGFRTFFAPLDATLSAASGLTGLSDGDIIGVIGDTTTLQNGDEGQGGAAPDGSQYYAIEDPDGFVYVQMDAVEITGRSSVTMSGWAHFEATTWEVADLMRIWADDPTTSAEVVLLSAIDADDVASVVEDQWTEYTSGLSSLTNSA